MARDDVDRRIGARSFARLLGDWRPPGGRGLTAALADRVRLLVLDGRLPLQIRVPAERELAVALDVSRTTVAAAYEALREAGILNSRRGAGSWTQLPPGITASGVSSPFSPHGDRTLFDLAHASLAARRCGHNEPDEAPLRHGDTGNERAGGKAEGETPSGDCHGGFLQVWYH